MEKPLFHYRLPGLWRILAVACAVLVSLPALTMLPQPAAWSVASRFAKPGDLAAASGQPSLDEDLSLRLAGTRLRFLWPVWPRGGGGPFDDPWWQLSSPEFSLGRVLEAPAWSLLRGSLTGLLEESGARSGGGFLRASPADGSQREGLGLSLLDCLDFGLSRPLGGKAADWLQASLAAHATLALDAGQLAGRISALWSQRGDGLGIRSLGGEDWWLDRPGFGPEQISHVQLQLGGIGQSRETGGELRLFGQLSVPRFLSPGWMAGGRGHLILKAAASPRARGADSLDWGLSPSQEGQEIAAAEPAAPPPSALPGQLLIGLEGRASSETWLDQYAEALPQPARAGLDLDWRPIDGLQARTGLDFSCGRLPWGKAAGGPERAVRLDWTARGHIGDSRLGLTLDGEASWERDAKSAWTDAQSLALGLRGRSADHGGYLRADASAGWQWASAALRDFKLGVEMGGCVECPGLRVLAGVAAGLAAPPQWWQDPAGASPSLRRDAGLRARINLGLATPHSQTGRTRIACKASAGLPADESIQRLAEWQAGAAPGWDSQLARLLAHLEYGLELTMAAGTE